MWDHFLDIAGCTACVLRSRMLYLIAATVLIAITALLALAQPRWPLWRRAIWRLIVFISLTLLLTRIVGSPLHPDYAGHAETGDAWAHLIEAAWWVIGARVLVGTVRLLVILEHRPRETRIISDLLAGAIYTATLLAVVNFAFQVPIAGLVATSGIAAIVLGLALQSTLSDVFSGIAVGIERPFKAGDMLWVEGGNIEGRVLQVNWRSTQIATNEGNIAVVPNSIIAKARLVNRSLPTPARREKIELRISADAPPEDAIRTLRSAVRACLLLMDAPAAAVECTALEGDGNIYQVWFSIADADHLSAARTELLTQIHRHLRHAGILLSVAGLATTPRGTPPSAAEIMAQSDLFGVIETSQRELVASYLTKIDLQPGEVLIRQGDDPTALFILAAGTLEITVRHGEAPPHVVYRMGPGETVGAIGLITSMPYAATATALTLVLAFRLDKASIASAIMKVPALRDGLQTLAERGQAALQADTAAPTNQMPQEPEVFREKLRHFLEMLGN